MCLRQFAGRALFTDLACRGVWLAAIAIVIISKLQSWCPCGGSRLVGTTRTDMRYLEVLMLLCVCDADCRSVGTCGRCR